MSAAMKEICTPTRRYQDMLRYQDSLEASTIRDDLFHYTEVQLAIPVEDFLVYRWDWTDLKAFLRQGTPKILWSSETAFLAVEESGDRSRFDDHGYISVSIQAMSAVY